MAHQVEWNKIVVERFVELAMLTEDEEMILRTRVAGWPRTRQANELNMSVSSVDRIIRRLKKKYDNVQRFDPILPKRKESAAELWMDTH